MAGEKSYHMKWSTTVIFLLMVLSVVIMYALTLQKVGQLKITEGLQVFLVVLVLLVCAFVTRRTAICLTEDGISMLSNTWVKKHKKLRFSEITEVYKVRLFFQTYFVVEGRSQNKTVKIQIVTHIKDWEDMLRTLVSKVDTKIVDIRILQLLGIETTTERVVGSSSDSKKILPFHYISWLFRNLIILLFATFLSAWISYQFDPDRGLLTIAVYLVSWTMAFFFIGYFIPVKRWMNLLLSAAVFSFMSWHFHVSINWNLLILIFVAMIIGGVLSSRFNKFTG